MKLTKFRDPLPIPPILSPVKRTRNFTYYEAAMKETKHYLHSELPETTIWGYEGIFPGPTIEVESGEKVYIKWINWLPNRHILPIDHSVHGAGTDVPDVRAVVHLHGGRTEPESDGYPDAWFTSNFDQTGPFFRKTVYEYHNLQDSRCLWYHDHAIGITRLNIYAGLAGFYIIRDQLERSFNLPSGSYEVPLMLQDRSINEDGTLFYPNQPDPPILGIKTSIIPAFFGDTIVVNGKVWPYLEVEPRKYRFRILNGANSRFFRLSLGSDQMFFQIGTDSGFLERPAAAKSLLLAPAERVDVIIDFSNLAGNSILLTNDAPTHFPRGNPVQADTTGIVMQFRVVKPLLSVDTSAIPTFFRPINRLSVPSSSRSRYLVLSEEKDQYGRSLFLLDQKKWDDPISENPVIGSSEIWNFININEDDHPIHIHLVQFLILERRAFDVEQYKKTRTLTFTSPPILPDQTESSWKDTVKCPPGLVTRIIIPFFPYTGQYVWHCHMLEHEDYEMMRPYIVNPQRI
jgi:spore coat protein A